MSSKLFNQVLLVITLLGVVTSFSCKKQCENAAFAYNAISTIKNPKNIYKINDTIYFEIVLPKCGLELISNRTICLEKLDIVGGLMNILDFDSSAMASYVPPVNLNHSGAIKNFNFLIERGHPGLALSERNSEGSKHFALQETSTFYQLKLGLIPIKRGFYQLSFPSLRGLTVNMSCRVTTAGTNFVWPTAQLNQMLGVNNWQSLPNVRPEGFFLFKVN